MPTPQIISRSTWGASAWRGTPASVPLSRRTEFYVHYDGGHPVTRTGYAIMRAIEAQHIGQGWSGVGYNFVIDQQGHIFEGRGWGLQGAHCPDHNTTGIGVQIAIGGDQKPSEKALAACRALYELACKKTGKTLAKRGHRDGFATLCPGGTLYAWVQAGMPAGDYEASPAPGGSLPGGTAKSVSRKRVTINGLSYGYGSVGAHVTAVGEALVKLGFGRHYTSGPGPTWTDADTRNYQEYQESLGFTGDDADGVPGTTSLKKLLGSLPRKITAKPMPPYPGRDKFGPGKKNKHVKQWGKQLQRKGFGTHYRVGPSETWTEVDRLNTRDLQLAHKELAGDADGLPGPLTWRIAFS